MDKHVQSINLSSINLPLPYLLLDIKSKIIESNQLFRALVENSPDFIARYDREYRRIYVNPAIKKLFKNPKEDILGETPAKHSPLYAPQIYIDHIKKAIETAAECIAEIPFRTEKGEMHWGHMRFVPEFGPDGKVFTVLAIGRDITERKQAEEELKELMYEINRFNKLMIDREEKMIELKKEINLLLEKDGKPKKYDVYKEYNFA